MPLRDLLWEKQTDEWKLLQRQAYIPVDKQQLLERNTLTLWALREKNNGDKEISFPGKK